jgi:hypothetical protein
MEQAVDKNEATNKKLGISEGHAHRLDEQKPKYLNQELEKPNETTQCYASTVSEYVAIATPPPFAPW